MTLSLAGAGRGAILASATALTLLFSGPAHAADPVDTAVVPPAGTVSIAASSNGSGCVGDTAKVTLWQNNNGFSVTYRSEYLAWSGVGSEPADFRKNCQVNLQVDRPDGYTYAIAAARHRGAGGIESGATGLQRWSYYFQGSSTTKAYDHHFTGPFGGDWLTSDVVAGADLTWAPCNAERNLNVNTELRVTKGTSDPDTASFLAVNWTDDQVDDTYRFIWKHC